MPTDALAEHASTIFTLYHEDGGIPSLRNVDQHYGTTLGLIPEECSVFLSFSGATFVHARKYVASGTTEKGRD
jgi:hypothetical protein